MVLTYEVSRLSCVTSRADANSPALGLSCATSPCSLSVEPTTSMT
jgi:hypothetical protein